MSPTPSSPWWRVWTSLSGLIALGVIVVGAIWRGVVLGKGFFSQDDYLLMSTSQHLSWSDFFSPDFAGGFAPGSRFAAWAQVTEAPLNWPAAAAVVLALQLGAGLLMWLVLGRLVGSSWIRLPALVLFTISPLTLWTTQWWAVSMQFWPATVLLLLALWALLKADQDGDRRWGLLVVVSFGAALMFSERAVLDVVVLLGVVVLARSEDTFRARFGIVLRTHAVVWVGLVGVLVGYAVLRVLAAPLEVAHGAQLGQALTNFLRHGTSELFGGPWAGAIPAHAYLEPKSWAVALNGAVLLGLVGFTLQRGGVSARVSWGLLVLFVAGTLSLIAVLGRGDFVASLGLVHRCAADIAPVFTLCVAGAFSAVDLPELRLSDRLALPGRLAEAVVASACAILLVVSAAISTAFLAPSMYHRDDRSYVSNLRASLRADPQVVLLDGGVPAGVISPWFTSRAVISSVAAYAPERPVFDIPSQKLRMVRDDGRVIGILLEGAVNAEPAADPTCGYHVRAGETRVRMRATVPQGRWVVRFGYYTSVDGFANANVAGQNFRFPVRNGLNAVEFLVQGSFEDLQVSLEDADGTLCLAEVTVGVPRPGEQ